MPVTHGEIVAESGWDEDAGVEGFIYIRAATTLYIPYWGSDITQRITSPGIYRVDPNSEEGYLDRLYEEELDALTHMLAELGATPR